MRQSVEVFSSNALKFEHHVNDDYEIGSLTFRDNSFVLEQWFPVSMNQVSASVDFGLRVSHSSSLVENKWLHIFSLDFNQEASVKDFKCKQSKLSCDEAFSFLRHNLSS